MPMLGGQWTYLVDVAVIRQLDHDLQLLHLDIDGIIVLAEEHLHDKQAYWAFSQFSQTHGQNAHRMLDTESVLCLQPQPTSSLVRACTFELAPQSKLMKEPHHGVCLFLSTPKQTLVLLAVCPGIGKESSASTTIAGHSLCTNGTISRKSSCAGKCAVAPTLTSWARI